MRNPYSWIHSLAKDRPTPDGVLLNGSFLDSLPEGVGSFTFDQWVNVNA